jgi:hypothetical protein
MRATGISISNSNFTNCDLKAVGSAALISVSNTQSVSAGGGSSISIESEKGFVQVWLYPAWRSMTVLRLVVIVGSSAR